MKITEIRIGRTINLGSFNSLKLEAAADVADGEDPGMVRARLGEWLLDQVAEESPQPARRAPAKTDLPF